MNHEQDGDAMVVESPISVVQESSIISTPPTSPHPGLSMTKDAVRISATMSAVGFDIAKRNTDYGFGMTKAFMRSANAFLHENGHVEEGTSVSSFLRATEVMMERAHRVIGQGLSVTHVITPCPNHSHITQLHSISTHFYPFSFLFTRISPFHWYHRQSAYCISPVITSSLPPPYPSFHWNYQDVAQSSLTMADDALTRAGIRNGELYKRIAQVGHDRIIMRKKKKRKESRLCMCSRQSQMTHTLTDRDLFCGNLTLV